MFPDDTSLPDDGPRRDEHPPADDGWSSSDGWHADDSSPLDDERCMRHALAEARAAEEHEDVPVGAVVVRNQRVIARGHNQKELLQDPTAHAEMLAITAAAEAVGDWRLTDCTLYVTLEPCPMCAGAIVLARLKRVVFATEDPKFGACGSLYTIANDPRTNHQVSLTAGVGRAEAAELLQAFFRRQRALGKK